MAYEVKMISNAPLSNTMAEEIKEQISRRGELACPVTAIPDSMVFPSEKDAEMFALELGERFGFERTDVTEESVNIDDVFIGIREDTFITVFVHVAGLLGNGVTFWLDFDVVNGAFEPSGGVSCDSDDAVWLADFSCVEYNTILSAVRHAATKFVREHAKLVVVCVNEEYASELGDDREYDSVDELAMDILESGFVLPKAGLKKGRDYEVVPASII